MIITKLTLPRRTFLRGAGAAVAVRIVPTDEERVIAEAMARLLHEPTQPGARDA